MYKCLKFKVNSTLSTANNWILVILHSNGCRRCKLNMATSYSVDTQAQYYNQTFVGT